MPRLDNIDKLYFGKITLKSMVLKLISKVNNPKTLAKTPRK